MNCHFVGGCLRLKDSGEKWMFDIMLRNEGKKNWQGTVTILSSYDVKIKYFSYCRVWGSVVYG